jgi:hypothetical protein
MQRSKGFRIVFESYDIDEPESLFHRETILSGAITPPTNCLDFSLSHESQIALIQDVQDKIIAEKVQLLNQELSSCPNCQGRLKKRGKQTSTFHDVFTDHTVKIQRVKCESCGYEVPATVRNLLNGSLSGALAKIQSELGACQTFRDSEQLFETFSGQARGVNNHNRIKEVTQKVGSSISSVDLAEKALLSIEEAEELIVCVDGGHVKTTENQRSIEAITSIIYRPDSLVSNKLGTRNRLTSKSCAASVKDDEQREIIDNTIVAAVKQGLTPNTHITALCDGANNCWNVVEALRPLSSGMTCILDWFHIAMKMQNIALPDKDKGKFLRIKWHLWRGNTEAALTRLQQLLDTVKSRKYKEKIEKFRQYIRGNAAKIVDYRDRKNKGLVFTSSLAESTVESLINRRCKGQQHMRWSREGLNPILQLRAKLHTSDWKDKWKQVILNTAL